MSGGTDPNALFCRISIEARLQIRSYFIFGLIALLPEDCATLSIGLHRPLQHNL